jgi:hypothetical protein
MGEKLNLTIWHQLATLFDDTVYGGVFIVGTAAATDHL